MQARTTSEADGQANGGGTDTKADAATQPERFVPKARMRQPVMVLPGAMQALLDFNKTAETSGVPAVTLGLVHLRTSQINGCSFCIDMHVKGRLMPADTAERLFAVAAWREAPYFTAAERAALALAEAVTRLSDRPDAVPDEVWDEAARHFDEKGLAGLLVAIASVNVWNRLNVATRQIAGHWPEQATRDRANQEEQERAQRTEPEPEPGPATTALRNSLQPDEILVHS